MSVVVFCGPTVDAATVRTLLPDADCRPPAGQGDLHAAAQDRPAAIALIDGVFCERPAVWHREVLAALAAGIPVWGAASMGALRAVECARFGMIGHGRVVAAYRCGRYAPFDDPFEDDDEVAVVHGPPELGAPPLSDALVDLRETLVRAAASGALELAARDTLLAECKRMFFAERSFAQLTAVALERLGPAAVAALEAHRASIKREDAAAMLATLARDGPGPRLAEWRPERTIDWERFVAGAEAQAPTSAERAALARLAHDPRRRRTLERRAAARLAALDLAPDKPPETGDMLGDFRLERGLASRVQLDAWLETNALTARGLAELLRSEAALAALVDRFPPERLARAMLDEMRLTDVYAGSKEAT